MCGVPRVSGTAYRIHANRGATGAVRLAGKGAGNGQKYTNVLSNAASEPAAGGIGNLTGLNARSGKCDGAVAALAFRAVKGGVSFVDEHFVSGQSGASRRGPK